MASSVQHESLSEVHGSIGINSRPKGWRRLIAFMGPAYLVSVGYMDPGNWATDIAGGSQFGYSLIWVLLMSNLMALLLQSLSARLGIVRGVDLAQASRNSYPPIVNIPLYVLAEIAIAACDLAEIIGMAIGLNLLFGLPLIFGVCITIFDTILILFLMNKGIRIMEMFIISMVSIIGFSFLAEMLIVQPVVSEILSGFKPTQLSGNALYIAIGIIGATVMPHNLYLHSSLVQTRKIERTNKGIKEAIRFNFFDTTIALNLAFFVNSAILILAATAFYKNGFFEIAEIQDAHKLLNGIFGSLAPTLFAVALIASGQSSTITGTLAGQIIMEGYLNLRLRPWIRRLITRLIAIIPALFTILYFGEEKLGDLLVLSQVILSLQLGFAVIPLIHFTSEREHMKEFTIKTWVKILAWLSALIIVGLNVKLVYETIGNWIADAGENTIYIYVILFPIAAAVLILLLYVTFAPLFQKHRKNEISVPHPASSNVLAIEDLPEKSYAHIAVTVDFSSIDNATIRTAIIQGGKTPEYLLIHIVETAGARYLGDTILDYETRSDTEKLATYVSTLQEKGYKANYQIGYGDATKSISEIISKKEIDLLVMGGHGHKGLKDLIFGATVDSVRHKVNVPVLIVKSDN